MKRDTSGRDTGNDARWSAPASPVVECAQCGERLAVLAWSEYVEDHARHLWECRACGYSFETIVRHAAA